MERRDGGKSQFSFLFLFKNSHSSFSLLRFNISVPVYVNNEPTLLEEFVQVFFLSLTLTLSLTHPLFQQRKYVNVSTHNLTVKLQLNVFFFFFLVVSVVGLPFLCWLPYHLNHNPTSPTIDY